MIFECKASYIPVLAMAQLTSQSNAVQTYLNTRTCHNNTVESVNNSNEEGMSSDIEAGSVVGAINSCQVALWHNGQQDGPSTLLDSD